MRLKLTAAPQAEPVSLDEAKNFLKVDSADDNALISALIMAARQLVESSTLRALITQTWEMTLDEAKEEIWIPRPPLQKVNSVKVVLEDGTESPVDPSLYWVDASGGGPGRLRLKTGVSWPVHRGFASIVIEFDAGYGDAADSVPQALKEAALRALGHYYSGRQGEDLPAGVRALMRPYKVIYL